MSQAATNNVPNRTSSGIITRWKTSLLHWSIQHNFRNITHKLIRYGCDIDSQDDFGKTSLMKATYKLQSKTVQILLDRNANMLLSDFNGKNALQTVMEFPSTLECIPIIQMFAAKIADICSNNSEDIIQYLSSVKYSFNQIIYFKDANMTRTLLTCGQRVNERNPCDGNTALHTAVMLRDLENVKVLLQYGANKKIVNNEGCMPFFSILNDEKVMNNVPLGPKITEMLNLVMPLNVNWTTRDKEGKLNLRRIFTNSSSKSLQYFLEKYTVNLDARDANGETALHYLVESNKTDVYEVFKDMEIDVNVRDICGRTPLHIAAMRGNVDAVRFLLDKGANINFTYNRLNPVFLAFGRRAWIDQHNCIALLLQNSTIEQLTFKTTTIYMHIFKRCDDNFKSLSFLKSVTAHIALLEKLGQPSFPFDPSVPFYQSSFDTLDPYFQRKWAKKIAKVTKYYWAYRKQLEDMQNEKVRKSLSLFDIMVNDDFLGKELSKHVWKIERLVELEEKINNKKYSFYYKFRLNTKLDNAKKLARWRNEVLDILCETTGLFQSDHLVVENIVRLLEYEDLKMFGKCIDGGDQYNKCNEESYICRN